MGISIDNSIRLLQDYHKWEKKFGIFGSGVDDATEKLLEVAKKYQKIEDIYYHQSGEALENSLREVIENGNDDN